LLIQKEFKDAAEEIIDFNRFNDEYEKVANPSTLEVKRHIQLMASSVEKTYTFIERILSEIIREVDGQRLTGDAWHKTLLLVAANKTENRPEIISSKTYEVLDDLRTFRHLERNRYPKELDQMIVFSNSMNKGFDGVQSDFKVFAKLVFNENFEPFTIKDGLVTPILKSLELQGKSTQQISESLEKPKLM